MAFAIRFAFIPLLVLAACSGGGDSEPQIAVENGWVRSAPGGTDITAAYFTLENTGGADTLTGVSSDQLDRVEMHSGGVDENGLMRMEEMASVEVPAGGAAVFAPGADHLMLYGAADLSLGDTVCLNLQFAVSGERIACFPVMDDAPLD